MKKYLAQIQLGPSEGFRGIGPLGLEGRGSEEAPSVFTNFLSSAIGLLTVVAAIIVVFNLIIGAIGIITAGSDKAKVEEARNKITMSIVGIVVIVASLFIIQLIGSLIGIGDIILNPVEILNRISP